jgi:hypothetical protein
MFTSMKRVIKFRYLLVASIFTAVTGALVPYYLATPDVSLILLWGFSLGVLWFALLVAAVFWYRWKGLWLIIGAPLAFYWPIAFEMLRRACAQNINACP